MLRASSGTDYPRAREQAVPGQAAAATGTPQHGQAASAREVMDPSMANGLETRLPFLDHSLVEFSWQLPMHMKIRDRQGKWLLRQLLYQHVPRHLIERPKQGFAAPLACWLRGPLRDWAESLLNESRLSQEGYLKPGPVVQRWREHLSGRRNWEHWLWNVLMFQAWRERWA